MALDFLLLFVGLGLLLAGGRILVSGSSHLARSLGVSELAIGLTVVAFGTSAPELAVNILAAIRGSAELAFGNVVGSNIANIGLVIGLSAILRPLRIESQIVSREIPMMLLATAVTGVLGLDRMLHSTEAYTRQDGIILLLLFSVFLYYTISEIIADRRGHPGADALDGDPRPPDGWSAWKSIAVTIAGLAILLAAAEVTVNSAVSLAEAFDVSSAVIGLTLVAFGTSLPELVISLTATWKGRTNLAIGNVVGSNMFNLLFVLASTAIIKDVNVPAGGEYDLAALAIFSLALIPFSRSDSQVIRWEGIALVIAYFSYIILRVAFGPLL